MDFSRIRRQMRLLAVAEPELPFHPRLYGPDAFDRYMQNGIRPEVLGDAYSTDPVADVVRGANVLGAHTDGFRPALLSTFSFLLAYHYVTGAFGHC